MPRSSVGQNQFETSGAHSPVFRGNRRNRTQPACAPSSPRTEQPPRDSAAVFVAAGSPQFLAGFISKLTFGPDIQIEGDYCRDLHALFAALQLHSPVAVMVDCELFHQMGYRVLREIRSRIADACLILVFDRHYHFPEAEIVINDVRGCLPADRPSEFYSKALHSILAGEFWLPNDLVGRIIQAMNEQLEIRPATSKNVVPTALIHPALTLREAEIGELVLDGFTNEERRKSLQNAAFTGARSSRLFGLYSSRPRIPHLAVDNLKILSH